MSRSINDRQRRPGLRVIYVKKYNSQIRAIVRECLHHKDYDHEWLTRQHRHNGRWDYW